MSRRDQRVSCLALSFIFQFAEDRGVPRARLQEGLAYPPAHLDDRLAWVDVATYVEVQARLARLLPYEPDLYYQLGRSLGGTSLGFLRAMAALVVSPEHLYLRIPLVVSTFLFPMLEIRFERRGPRELEGRYRIPPELLSDAFVETIRGQLVAAPRLLGAPEASVRVSRTASHELRFEVTVAKGGLAARLGDATAQLLGLIWLRGKAIDAASRELVRTRRMLLDKLEEARQRAADLERANERLRAEAEERTRVQHALRESEERYRLLFDAAADLIAVVGQDGTLLELNARFEEESGYARAEVIGRPLHETGLLSAESTPRALAALAEILRHGSSPIFEVTGVRKDGGTVPYELRAVPIRRDGRVVAVQAILRNLTERRRLEQQLAQAQRMESLGRLAGGLAHNFNNLLTVVKGNLSLALFSLPPAHGMRRPLEDARDASDRAAALTRQLLAVGRRGVLRLVATDLNALILDLRRLIEGLLDEQIRLELKLDPARGSARVDRAQIEQILINLVSNARDAMPDGGTLTIATRVTASEVVVSVEDTGIGMDRATQERIFEPFFTTKPRERGTGLGLAVVYGAVQQLGGTIAVRSEPGRGSRFEVAFPRCEEPAEPAAETAPPPPRRERPPTGTEAILLVEDEEAVRVTTRRLLEHLGYEVLEAAGGSEAIAIAERHGERIALLLSDVLMPGMNGRELADRLVGRMPRLKVLFISGHAAPVLARRGILEDDAELLVKPFTAEALAVKLRDLLDTRVVR